MKHLVAALMAVALLGCDGDSAPDVVQSGVGIVAEGCAGTTKEFGSGIAVDRPGHVVTTALAVVWSPDNGVRPVSVMITRRLDITIEDIYVEDEVRRSGLELVGDISVGDSGGAVVDGSGDVVGIIYARSRPRPQTAFATDDGELERLLSERPLDATDRCQ